MKKQNGFTSVELVIVIIGLFAVGGWIANIVKLIHMGFDPLTGMAVARVVGVFAAPLGAVLGYL